MSETGTGRRLGLSFGRALAAITIAAAVLRLAFLARQPIGYDEDFTAVVLHQPLGRMLDVIGRDSAPPLFYLLEWLPAQIVASPWALRLVPALAGIALIPLVAALARRVGGDSSGLWAAAFVAVLPATVLLSDFARMYGLAGTLTVAATLLLWRATESPSLGRWAAYTAAAGAAVWTDYFAVVALAGIVPAGVWLRPSRRIAAAAVLATAAAVLTLTPWLLYARAQFEHAGQGFWISPLSPTVIAGTFGQIFSGPLQDSRIPFGPELIALQLVALAAGCAALAAAAIAWRRQSPESRRAGTFCLLSGSGVLILVIVSFWRPLLEARYASIMWLPLFALAGVGLAAVPQRVAVALVVALAVPALALSVAITHSETSTLVPELNARVGDHDLVAASPNHYLVLLDEAGPLTQARLHLLAPEDPPWFDGTAAYPPGAVIHAVPADVSANGGRVFWVADPGAPPPPLPAAYHSLESRCAIGVCLTVYGPAD
jgi:4-amino-4-deoxy-L-arabinose transferase-like glycosyltransferase